MTIRNILLALGLHMAAASSAFALTISLDFNSLPSAQGWTYIASPGVAETTVYSVDGSALIENSTGIGGRWAYYQIPGIVDPSLGYSLQMRARVLSQEGSEPTVIGLAATAPSWYSRIGLGVASILATDSTGMLVAGFDNSVFHDYSCDVAPSGQYRLSVDGTLLLSGQIASADLPNAIYFGKDNSGYNGSAVISRLSFSQPIPEPETYAMLLAGLALVGIAARRRERATAAA